MGRAYEVRKASIQKTGAARGKIYTNFAKEIYLAAKGNPDLDTNIKLKRNSIKTNTLYHFISYIQFKLHMYFQKKKINKK